MGCTDMAITEAMGQDQMRLPSGVTLALVALIPVPLCAAGLEYNVNGGIGNSNNITRAAASAQSETFATVGAQISLQHASRRLTADVTGDLSYVDYLNDTYRSELIGSLGAAVRMGLVDDRLSWVVEESFGQTRLDAFAPTTPANRENVNFLSTGPDLSLRLSAVLRVNVQARYSRLDYQTSDFDSNRYRGLLGLERDLSGTNRISLNVSGERVLPRRGGGSSFTRSEAFIRYASEAARTTLSTEFGASQVEVSGVTDGDFLARVNLSRKIGSLSTLTLRASHAISDNGNSLGQGNFAQLPRATLETGALSQTDRPYTSEVAGVEWRVQGRVTRATLSADWSREDYAEAGNSSRTYLKAGVGLGRQFGPRLDGRIGFTYTRNEYPSIVDHTNESAGEIGLAWRLGRRVTADFSAARTDFSGNPLFATSPETRLWLQLRYGDRINRE